MVPSGRDEIQAKRMRIEKRLIVCSVCLLSGLFLLGAFVWAAFDSLRETTDSTGFIAFLIMLLAAVFGLLALLGRFLPEMEACIKRRRQLRLLEEPLLSPAQLQRWKRWKHIRPFFLAGFAGAVAIAVLVLIASKGVLSVRTYREAIALVDCGEYEKAGRLFRSLPNSEYHDTQAYLSLCEAMDYESREMYFLAFDELEKAEFSELSDEQEAALRAIAARLEEEKTEQQRQIQERQQKEYYEKLARIAPYVGIAEKDIGRTSLGEPARVETHTVNGKECTDYYFEKNGVTIYAARCINGSITQVSDGREKDDSSGGAKTGSSHSGKKTGKKTGSGKNDPYDVGSYQHPEDFYYDYVDDFYDYEEAEDYYNAHHG